MMNPVAPTMPQGALGLAVATLLAAVGIAQPAAADDTNLITSKGYASLGTFSNESDLTVRLDGSAGDGTDVDWNQTFGNIDDMVFRLDGLWRFTEKHHLRMMYTDFSREREATLEEDIDWGDDTILAGSTLGAEFGFSIIEGAYEYALKHDENLELALSAGLHWVSTDFKLRYKILTPGSTVEDTVGRDSSTDLPLPVFGGRALWHMGHDFYLDATVQWFALSIDEYDGDLINYRAAVIWQPKKWIGVGIGYDSFDVNLDIDKDKFKGSVEWTYQGPQIFYNVNF